MSDVHGLVEVLDLAEALGKDVKTILADGKVDWRDVPTLTNLWSPAKAALADVKVDAAEIAALDGAGVQVLVDKITAVIGAWMDVFTVPGA